MADLKTSVSIELVDKITKPIKEIKQGLGGVATSEKKLAESTKKASNETNKQTKELQGLSKESKKTESSLENLSRGFTGMIAGMGISSKLKNALSDAGETQSLGIKLSTVMGDNSLSEFEDYFTELERTGIATYKEIAETGYNLLSAGLSGNQAKLGAKTVIDVAKITGGQADSVASTMATASKNFGIDMERVGDIFAKTQFKFQFANFGVLGAGFDMVGASAAAVKLPLEQTATALGMLNDAGIAGSSAGTALNAVLRQMGKASETLGIEIPRMADGSLDLVSFLQSINKATADLTLDEKAQLFQEIFGDEGKRGLLPLIKDLDKMSANLEDVTKNSKDLTKQEVSKFYNSYETKASALVNSLGGISDAIGTAVIPHMIKLIDTITPLINSFADFIYKNEWLGQALFYTGVALAGVVSIMGAMYIIKPIIAQFLFLGKASMFAAGFMKTFFSVAIWGTRMLSIGFVQLGIAIMTTPIGWIFGGIALIAGGAYLIIKHWKPAGDFFTSFWESIKASVKTVYDWLLKYIIEPITAIWDKVKGFFGSSKIESKSEEIKEVKNNLAPIQPQTTKQNKVDGNIVYNNTFNINGSNLNANEIAELVMQKLQKQNRTSLAGS